MPDTSKNLVSKLKHIESGLAVYQTGRSPFYHARLWTLSKKYVRRPSKEASRFQAGEAALEFADGYGKNGEPVLAVAKDGSFETYARTFDAVNKAKNGNARSYSDGPKIPL